MTRPIRLVTRPRCRIRSAECSASKYGARRPGVMPRARPRTRHAAARRPLRAARRAARRSRPRTVRTMQPPRAIRRSGRTSSAHARILPALDRSEAIRSTSSGLHLDDELSRSVTRRSAPATTSGRRRRVELERRADDLLGQCERQLDRAQLGRARRTPPRADSIPATACSRAARPAERRSAAARPAALPRRSRARARPPRSARLGLGPGDDQGRPRLHRLAGTEGWPAGLELLEMKGCCVTRPARPRRSRLAAGEHDRARVLELAHDGHDLRLRLLDDAPALRRHQRHLVAHQLGRALRDVARGCCSLTSWVEPRRARARSFESISSSTSWIVRSSSLSRSSNTNSSRAHLVGELGVLARQELEDVALGAAIESSG